MNAAADSLPGQDKWEAELADAEHRIQAGSYEVTAIRILLARSGRHLVAVSRFVEKLEGHTSPRNLEELWSTLLRMKFILEDASDYIRGSVAERSQRRLGIFAAGVRELIRDIDIVRDLIKIYHSLVAAARPPPPDQRYLESSHGWRDLRDLGVVTREVVDAADGWPATKGSVGTVMVVPVDPGLQGAVAGGIGAV